MWRRLETQPFPREKIILHLMSRGDGKDRRRVHACDLSLAICRSNSSDGEEREESDLLLAATSSQSRQKQKSSSDWPVRYAVPRASSKDMRWTRQKVEQGSASEKGAFEFDGDVEDRGSSNGVQLKKAKEAESKKTEGKMQMHMLTTLLGVSSFVLLTNIVTCGLFRKRGQIHLYHVVNYCTFGPFFFMFLFVIYATCLTSHSVGDLFNYICRHGYLQRGLIASVVFALGIVIFTFVLGGLSPALVGLCLGLVFELLSILYVRIPVVVPARPSVSFAVGVGLHVVKCGLYASVAQNLWKFEHDHSLKPTFWVCLSVLSSTSQYFLS